MTKNFFAPYVGASYENGFNGKKLLVLGESHYCSEEKAVSDLTTKVIEEYLDPQEHYEHWKNTFRKFERFLAGKNINQEEREDLFSQFAFYNYVQEALPDARTKPTKEQFKNSEEPFWATLDKLQPDCMIVWGTRLANNMPWDNWTQDETIEINGKKSYTGHYTLKNGHIVNTLILKHPSSGFSWKHYNKVLTKWLER